MIGAEPIRDTLGRMGRSAVPVEDETDASAMRRRITPSVEAMMRKHAAARRARRSTRPLLMLAAFLTSFAALAIGARTWLDGAAVEPAPSVVANGGTVKLVIDGQPRPLAAGEEAPLRGGAHVGTPPSTAATLTLHDARVDVAGGTELDVATLEPGAESLHLVRGLVSVTVARLGSERSFSVSTADSRVVVHGTAFSVQAGSWTHVAVSSGVVAVHHADAVVMLRAGQSWSSEPRDTVEAPVHPGDAHPVEASAGSETSPAVEGPSSGDQPSGKPSVAAPASPARTSQQRRDRPTVERAPALAEPAESHESALDAQNELLRSAAAARRAGRSEEALALLSRLLIEHPSAPLSHEARVEQLRLLARSGDRAAALRAAQRYLSLYPDGFAAAEARALLD